MHFGRFAPLSLAWLGLLCGCQENSTSPPVSTATIEGDVEIVGGGVATDVVIRAYVAPQDNQWRQLQLDYPSLGFSPAAPALFAPTGQPPIATSAPDSSGHFVLSGLDPGDYVVDAELPGYACAAPPFVSLSGNVNVGILQLVEYQPAADVLQDTTWSAGSVMLLQDNVIVHPEAVLTIQGDVLILAQSDAALTVTGGIQVLGNPSQPVRFRLTEEAGDAWGGIVLEQPAFDCALSGVSIRDADNALRVLSGQAQVSQCLFVDVASFGVYYSAGAQGSVANSVILEGNQGLVADNSSPTIESNLILRTAGAGLSVKSYSSALVRENVVADCQTGIASDWETSPQIQNNMISGGQRGLDAQNGFTALVQYNEFSGQMLECIYLHVKNCYPQIEWNNFIAAPTVILHVNGNAGLQADTVFAPHNYWDGEDATSIPDRIIDGHDIGSPDNPIGPVDFFPPSSSPISEAGP